MVRFIFKIKMDLFKPTKIKVLGTIIVYIAEALIKLVGGTLGWFLLREHFQKIAPQITEIKEKVTIPPTTATTITFSAFFIKIVFFYLAVCLIINLHEKEKKKKS